MDFEEELAEGPWQFVVEDGLVQKWFEGQPLQVGEPLLVEEVGEIIDWDEIVGQTLIEEELPLEVPAKKE